MPTDSRKLASQVLRVGYFLYYTSNLTGGCGRSTVVARLLKVAVTSKRLPMTPTVASKLSLSSNESQADLGPELLNHKIELIGELAQAVANQFSNIMMAVTGYAELELKKTGVKDRRALEQVVAHATEATLLIQKLLDFSRNHSSSPQPLELDDVITGIGELMKRLLGDEAELNLKLDAQCGAVYADRIDVEQTLLALVLIARNAMPATGQLTVSTSLVNLGEEFVRTQDGADPGEYVVLSIETDATASQREREDESVAGRGAWNRKGLPRADACFERSCGCGQFQIVLPYIEKRGH